jgi:hypothetical protein
MEENSENNYSPNLQHTFFAFQQDQRRFFPSTSENITTTPKVSISIQPLLPELCKAIQRINDDLFIIKFTSSPSPSITMRNIPLLTQVLNNDPGTNYWDTKPRKKVGFLTNANGRVARRLGNAYVPTKSFKWLDHVPTDTSDPDPIITAALLDSRHTFLEMSQFRHYQFDSLRRAKQSTTTMLYHLLYPQCKSPSHQPICSLCHQSIYHLRWHCEQCAGFEVCASCMKSKRFEYIQEQTTASNSSSIITTNTLPKTPRTRYQNNHNSCVNTPSTASITTITSSTSQFIVDISNSCPPLNMDDLGMLPGHPHLLTPYRVTYMSCLI